MFKKMASLAFVVGSAIVNGLAFSGSNYLFSKLDKTDTKRHNIAMEALAKDQQTFEQNRLAQLDFINEKLKEQGHADQTFQNVDDALQEYYNVTGTQLQTFRKPIITDYYDATSAANNDASAEMTELIMITVGMVITFYVSKKYFSK